MGAQQNLVDFQMLGICRLYIGVAVETGHIT